MLLRRNISLENTIIRDFNSFNLSRFKCRLFYFYRLFNFGALFHSTLISVAYIKTVGIKFISRKLINYKLQLIETYLYNAIHKCFVRQCKNSVIRTKMTKANNLYLNPSNCIKPLFHLLHIIGIWPKETPKLWYKIYMTIAVGITLLLVLLLNLNCVLIFNLNELNGSTEAIYISVLSCMASIKFVILIKKQSKLINLTEKMDKELVTEDDQEEERILVKNMLWSKKFFKYSLTLNLLTLFIFNCLPIFKSEKELPVKYNLIDVKNNLILYILHYIIQVIGSFYLSILTFATDYLTSSVLNVLGGYYDILGCNFSKILWNQSTNDGDQQAERQKFYNLANKYTTLVNLTRQFEDIVSVVHFLQFSTSSIVICSFAFQFKVVSFVVMSRMSKIVYPYINIFRCHFQKISLRLDLFFFV